jgi:hypothetical protein
VILEAIGNVGLARLAEADEVWSDAMRDLGDQGDDITPNIGGGGIAMQEECDRCVHPTRLPIGHLRVEDGELGQANV